MDVLVQVEVDSSHENIRPRRAAKYLDLTLPRLDSSFFFRLRQRFPQLLTSSLDCPAASFATARNHGPIVGGLQFAIRTQPNSTVPTESAWTAARRVNRRRDLSARTAQRNPSSSEPYGLDHGCLLQVGFPAGGSSIDYSRSSIRPRALSCGHPFNTAKAPLQRTFPLCPADSSSHPFCSGPLRLLQTYRPRCIAICIQVRVVGGLLYAAVQRIPEAQHRTRGETQILAGMAGALSARKMGNWRRFYPGRPRE
jgi:hypothetical protein